MGIPTHWKQNRINPKCRKCGCKDFSDIGECTTCGELLVFFGGEIMPKEKTKSLRRKITAAEKWSKTRIPKNYKSRCIICGCNPPKIEDLYKDGFIPIMVALVLKEKPEWIKAKKIIERVYIDCDSKEKEIQLVTKAIIRKQNLILPAKNIEEFQIIANKFLDKGDYNVCLNCLTIENESIKHEEQKTSITETMMQVIEEDNNMGPKFVATEKPKKDWGEDTIDHEDWEDDPDENDLEDEDDDNDNWEEDDDWEEDWEETDHIESAPIATMNPSSRSTEELEHLWDNDDNDDWEEDIARVTGR
jgi:hypothetical protein